jgi:hypothetical protein
MALYIPGKWIHKVYGVAMLGIVIFAFLPGVAGKREMKGFCEALSAGTSLPAVQSQAVERGYEFTLLADDHALVEDEGYFGPQKCDLRFGAPGLLSTAYFYY